LCRNIWPASSFQIGVLRAGTPETALNFDIRLDARHCPA
jgi:hypothetical protein